MAVHRSIRRAAVPTALLAGLAAVGVGVWPALASEGDPELPPVSVEDLLVRVAESDTTQLSGTVRIRADLGLPEWGGILDGMLDRLEGPAGRLAELAAGEGTLHVAVDGPGRQRVSLTEDGEELTVIHHGQRLWLYDSERDTVYRAELPEAAAERDAAEDAAEDAEGDAAGPAPGELTPREAVQRLLDAAGEHADFAVDGTARVAGRSAYRLVVRPAAEAPLEQLRISVDAETGVPLALTAEESGGRSFDLAFTRIDYARPAGAVFDFTPPTGAQVHDLDAEDLLRGLLPEGVELPEGAWEGPGWADSQWPETIEELAGDVRERLANEPELREAAEHLGELLEETAHALEDHA